MNFFSAKWVNNTTLPQIPSRSLEHIRRRSSAKLLTKDEARRIAVNIAKLLELVRNPKYEAAN